jgi:tetratricopeptide (TPR) repeat protein
MAAPKIEEYEQLLAQSPSSPVFADLAEALIQQGGYERAVQVCSRSLEHHQSSVPLHVLWGRALIGLGRAAAAMDQFEKAIAVNPQDPHPYRLISDVLLKKGLYRSAIPILRKLVALQPGDAKLQQAFEHAQVAAGKGSGTPWPPLEPLAAPYSPQPSRSQPRASTPPKPPAVASGGNHVPPKSAGPRRVASANQESSPPSPPPLQYARPRLLGDLPDVAEPSAGAEADEPSRVSVQAAQEIAKKYERELQAEFTQKKARKSFLARNGWKLGIGTILLVAGGVGLGNYLRTRAAHRGQDLKDALTLARKAITQDTRHSYVVALEHLNRAIEMDAKSRQAWALSGYVQAILVAEYGGDSKVVANAVAALDHPKVRAEFPGLALAADYYLAQGSQKDITKAAVVAAKFEEVEVQDLAGRILLAQSDSKGALERFAHALKLSPSNVRTLVALGDYYRNSDDHPTALKFYLGVAAQLSPDHPGRIIGAAESRLALATELDQALKDLEKLPPPEELSPQLLARRELAHGRLLTAARQSEKAIEKLQAGARTFASFEYDFDLALADAYRTGGQMEAAQRTLESALKQKPKSEEAKEALGRILIARDLEREALSRLPADRHSRRISLIRGEAFAKAGDWRHARAELANTQLDGKFPSEAVLYLAMADAAEGQLDRAQTTLEKALAGSRKVKSDLRVALGKVYWQRGTLDRARSQFEEAAKDPDDFEGNCALGRLLIHHGTPGAAIPPLSRAIARNPSHGEARQALGRAYLDLGRISEAIAQFDSWEKDSPGAAVKDLAWALFYAGKFKDAEAAVSRALRSNSRDGDSHRLRAMLVFTRGQTKLGFSELKRANHLNSKDPETFCEIGRAFVRQGNSANALKAYVAAKREDNQSVCAAVGLHFARLPNYQRGGGKELLGLAHHATGTWNRAFAESTLARWWLAAGSQKEARKTAEQAVIHGPFFAETHLALGLVAMQQKDEDKAKSELGKAIDLDPANGTTRLALADLLARSPESTSQALEQYNAFLRIGGSRKDETRVKRLVASIKKNVASR